jgi:hypothetical protein
MNVVKNDELSPLLALSDADFEQVVPKLKAMHRAEIVVRRAQQESGDPNFLLTAKQIQGRARVGRDMAYAVWHNEQIRIGQATH